MSDRAVLISGASTGIGESTAGYLLERRFRVFAGVRTEKDAARLSSSGATPVFVDLCDPSSIDTTLQTVQDAVGDSGLHGLVNNAGISVTGPLEFLPLEDIRRQFDVNLFGQIALTQAFVPLLRTAQGRIVNMSSISGRVTAPLFGPYSMSKFALEAFTDALRRELYPWKIEVSSIQPASIATPIWRKGLQASKQAADDLPPRGRELYGATIEAIQSAAEKMSERSIPAESVARRVHHALTARKPKTRYLVGPGAKLQARLSRFLTDRALDKILRKLLGVD